MQTVCVEIYFQESKRHRLKKKNLGENRGFLFSTQEMDLVAHSAHASAHRRLGLAEVLLRQVGNHGLSGDEEASDRRRVLQGAADNLGRVDNALRDEVAVPARLSVVAESVVRILRESCRRQQSRPHRHSGKSGAPGSAALCARTCWDAPPGRNSGRCEAVTRLGAHDDEPSMQVFD